MSFWKRRNLIADTYQYAYFRCNVTIFDASRQQADYITKKGNSKVILLCLMNEDHYDAVYQREHIVTAGFAQCKFFV